MRPKRKESGKITGLHSERKWESEQMNLFLAITACFTVNLFGGHFPFKSENLVTGPITYAILFRCHRSFTIKILVHWLTVKETFYCNL